MVHAATAALLLPALIAHGSPSLSASSSGIRGDATWSMTVPIARFEATATDATAVYAACGGDVVKIDARRGTILWMHHGPAGRRTIALARTATKLLQLSVPSDPLVGTTAIALLDPASGATAFNTVFGSSGDAAPSMPQGPRPPTNLLPRS